MRSVRHASIYKALSTRSKKALRKKRHKFSKANHGKKYSYRPDTRLLDRLVRYNLAADRDEAEQMLFEIREDWFARLHPRDVAREIAYQ